MHLNRPPVTDPRLATRLGLALGGGGVLGAAHVGVLQVLAERGMQADVVAGTSAGAIIGAAYAGRMDLDELTSIVLASRWADVGDFSLSPGFGVFDTTAMRATIERVAGPDLRIEDLPRRFAAVATDLTARRPVIMTRGRVADVVAASASVPGLFRPAALDGRILVDGGLTQNLPIETAFGLGADHVIAVRVVPEWNLLPGLRTSTRVHGFEIRPDVTLVRPRLGARSQWLVRDLPLLVALGREAAERALDGLGPLDERQAWESAWRRLGHRIARKAERKLRATSR